MIYVSVGTAVMSKVFRDFSQISDANTEVLLRLDPNRFPPNPSQPLTHYQ
jgi:hypothetical protein